MAVENKLGITQKDSDLPVEMMRGIKWYNFSEFELGSILRYFNKGNLQTFGASKVVILPDFTPGSGYLPTGCSVEFPYEAQPEWRKFAISDVGCGMQLVESKFKWDEFEAQKQKWDNVYEKLGKNKGRLGDLGSGNHFLDAVVDDDQNVYFAIHTGSRSESPLADKLIDKAARFDEKYLEIVNWARNNRDVIRETVEQEYGQTKFVLDKPHNFFHKKEDHDAVVIYKGAVRLKQGELGLVPSSMDGQMALIRGEVGMEEINFAMSHGTGRREKRGAIRTLMSNLDPNRDRLNDRFASLKRKIYIPGSIKAESVSTELPEHYRGLDECLDRVGGLVTVVKRLNPIAYIGQVK